MTKRQDRRKLRRARRIIPKTYEAIRKAITRRIKKLSAKIKPKPKPSKHKVISRGAWGARAPRTRSPMTSTTNGVFVHHSVGPAPTTQAGEVSEMQAIQNYHMNSHGWNDIGYSFVVAPSGRIYEARGVNTAGAHTENYNSSSYGICVMGNYEINQPSNAAVAAVRWLRRDYLKLSHRPVRPHGEVNATACPGKYLRARIKDL